MIGNQAVVQRCLAAKDEWHAKASMIWGAFLKMFIPILVLFPGLMALAIFPVLRVRPFLLYLVLAVVGSLLSGWIYGAISG